MYCPYCRVQLAWVKPKDVHPDLYGIADGWKSSTNNFCTQVMGLKNFDTLTPKGLVMSTKAEIFIRLVEAASIRTDEIIAARENWTPETVLETENQ